MPTRQRRRRARRRVGTQTGAHARSRLSRAFPFAFVGAVAAVVAVLVIVSVGRGGESDAPVAAASGLPPTGGTQAPPSTSAAADTAERAKLLELGQRLVRPAGERAAAAAIRLQTASFGDGSVFDLAQERGNVVIFYFMTAWCAICIPEAQALAQIHETYADQGVRVLVLDIDVTENEGNLAGFREQAGNGEHLWAMDVDDQVARTYNVRLLDTTIFIDREGRVAYMDGSPTSYDVLAAIIEALLL